MHTQQPTDLRTNPDPVGSAQHTAPSPRQDIVAVRRESKPGIMTTEFWIMLAIVGATLVATYVDEDSLSRDDGWRIVAFVAAAYIVSRGLAKIGTADRKIQDRR